MSFHKPKLPADRTPFWDLIRYIVDWCASERVVQIKGFNVKETPEGKFFIPIPIIASVSNSVQQFKIISDGGDYWNCKTWDGTTLGGTITKVAKPYKLRAILPSATPHGGAIVSEIIRGVTYTYTYTAVVVAGVTIYYTRGVVGSDGSSETDFMIPDPVMVAATPSSNDIIYAMPFSTSTPATLISVVWIDLNVDARAWSL